MKKVRLVYSGRTGPARPGPGRDRCRPAGRSLPATRPGGTDHQRRPRQADRRPPRSRVQPGRRPRHPPGPGQPRPKGSGHPRKVDQPRHRHRRVHHRWSLGPRLHVSHRLRPRRPPSTRPHPPCVDRQRRHRPSRRRPNHPPRPNEHSEPPPPSHSCRPLAKGEPLLDKNRIDPW
jgi:hypothetical protein